MSKSRHSFTLDVATVFRAFPNEWIPAELLMAAGGKMAWRTRISNARKAYGLTIENKVVRDAKGVAQSFYRYVPPVALKQAGLFEGAA